MVKLTEDRKRKARTQAKRFSIDDWANVWRNIEQSSFLRGGNERGWRADFNFILSESNFVKILEGKYDSAQGAAGTSARRKSDREIGMGLARDRRTALDRAIDEGLTNLDVIEGIVR
ncbi:hypothetical protein [Novosphingobium sp. KN65.2]|uniref:hypothetical protein n=1 Tax=Novosphingobium sp. KN65.2 TaxID=1478134 RepID=UPI001E46A27A|nr:hypothetical protein [Novosphingobium sp. KN65.2]